MLFLLQDQQMKIYSRSDILPVSHDNLVYIGLLSIINYPLLTALLVELRGVEPLAS